MLVVLVSVQPERLGELAGSRAKITRLLRGPAAREHELDPLGRLQRTKQDRRAVSPPPADDVEAMVHPVGVVHVGVTASEVHGLVARGAAALVRVRGSVARSEIRLDLDDDTCQPPAVKHAHQPLPQ